MMVSTNTAFLDLIKGSQILSADELKRAAGLVDEHDDSKTAARKLVAAGLVSRWQAGQLLKGGKPTLVLGKYVLLDRLPWGSAHAVFLAKHPTMDRKVALNVLDKTSSARKEVVKSFLADARAIATLDHRHLIHVYDIDEADNRYFLVMEHVEGRSLHDALKASGPLSVEAAADVLRQVADGLDHAHRAKLVHGGLRPTNVLLDTQGVVKIIDLGVSKFDDPTQPRASEIKSTADDSQIMEVAEFLSPEQAAGVAATAQSDLYSLGCLGFMLLTGAPPYARGDYAQRLAMHQNEKVPDVRTRRKDAPEGLAKILQKLMAKAPGERYASAKDVVTQLESWWSEFSAQQEAAKPKAKPKPVAKPAPPAAKPGANGAKPAASAATKPVPAPKPSAPKVSPPAAMKPAAKPAAAPALPANGASGDAFPGIHLRGAKRSGAMPAIKVGGAMAAKANGELESAANSSDDTVSSPVVARKKTAKSPPPLPENAFDSGDAFAAPPAASGSSKSTKSRSKLPLVIALAGGALLLLLVGGGLGAYFLFFGSEKPATVAAKNQDEQKNTTDDDKPEGESSGSEETSGETEPTDDGGKTPTPPDDDPAGEPAGETGDPVPPVLPPDPPKQEPTDPVPPVIPPVEPPKEEPPPVVPPKEEPPAQPDPPTEKPASPFVALADAISLPVLKEEQKEPLSLGPIALPPDGICYIDLVGGDKATPKEGVGFSMDLARGGLAEREWEIKLVGSPKGDAIVAQLALTDKDLTFQWTAEAMKIDDAGYLANCQLNLRTGDHEKYVTLRQAQSATAIPVNLTRALHREKVEIDYAANPEAIMVEITKVDGVEKSAIEPKQQLAAKQDSTFIWFGEGDDRILGLRVDALMQKDLQLTFTPVINDPVAGPQKMIAKKLAGMKTQLLAASAQVNGRLQALNSNPNKNKLKDEIARTQQQLDGVTQSLDLFDKLEKQYTAVNGKANVQFRVYYTDGAHQVDLVSGNQVGEVAPPTKNERVPAIDLHKEPQ